MTVISNRYKIIEHIGKGGMGEVYLAEDILTKGARYALKTIRHDLLPKIRNKSIENFKNEVEIMTRFKHPNLVQVYDFGRYKSDYFIIMEYVEGSLLSNIIKSNIEYSLDEYLKIIIQFLRALEFIHSRYVIYRDIKPSNVIVKSSNIVKLMDFGISDIFQTKEAKIKGTLFYLAPEVMQGNVDYQTDIFSLGLVFYEILTKTQFFSKSSFPLNALIDLLGNEKDFQALQSTNLARIKEEKLKNIIGKMTSYHMKDRYHTCSEIISDINRAFKRSFFYETKETKESYVLGNLFVNRKKEFKTLKESLNTEKDYIMLIYRGASGSGKTRLFYEFMKYCKLNDISFFEVSCNEARTNYHAIQEILIQAIINSHDDILKKYGRFLKLLLPNLQNLKDYKAVIIEDKKLQRDIIVQNVSDFLMEYSKTNIKTVLNFDDLQWIDDGSLDIILDLMHKLELYRNNKSNLIILGNINQSVFSSSDSINHLLKNQKTRILDIKPFSDKDIKEYIENIFGRHFIDKSLLSQAGSIKDRIGGNPLLLGELLKDMLNRNIIIKDSNLWKMTGEFNNLDIPSNILDLLKERINRLIRDKTIKSIFKIMSIIRFDLMIPEIKTILKRKNIISSLFLLEKMELIKSYIIYDRKYYGFMNLLTKEAVKESILNKKDIHVTIANQLVIILNDDKGRYIDEIAFHYKEGKEFKKAIEYYLLSADYFKKYYFNEKAINCYDQAINLQNDKKEKNDISLKKADLLSVVGRWKESMEILTECLDISIKMKYPIQTAISKKIIGEIHIKKGNYEEALIFFNEAKKLFLEYGNKKEYYNVILALGTLYNSQSDFDKAMEYYHDFGKYCRDSGNEKGYYAYIGNIGTIYKTMGNYKKAIECYKKTIELSDKLQDKRTYSITIGNLGNIYKNMGLKNEAIDCYTKAMDICREIGDKKGYSRAMVNLGNIYKLKGEFDRALEYYQAGEKICKELEDKRGYSIAVNNIGTILFEKKDYEKAMESYKLYLTISEDIGFRQGEATALANIAMIYEESNDLRKALNLYKKASLIAEEIHDIKLHGHILTNMGIIHENLNERDMALKYYDKAIELFTKLEDTEYVCDLMIKQGGILYCSNEYIKAEKILKKAHVYAGKEHRTEIDKMLKKIKLSLS